VNDLSAYVRDAVEKLRLPTDTRVLGIEVTQEAAGSLDMGVEFSTGARSWASWPTGLELTHVVHCALELDVRLQFAAELARRRRQH
jgi:hypothetical protein